LVVVVDVATKYKEERKERKRIKMIRFKKV